MSDSTVTLPPKLLAATESLARRVLEAEPVARYQQAKDRLYGDEQAKSLLERLSAAQADLRTRQSKRVVTAEDVRSLRALQAEVQSNPLIIQYAMAQQDAVAFLPEVNRKISELLGVDFASLAGPGSC